MLHTDMSMTRKCDTLSVTTVATRHPPASLVSAS